jgi:pimeloyl-ACP methyl ester carboxylesterase
VSSSIASLAAAAAGQLAAHPLLVDRCMPPIIRQAKWSGHNTQVTLVGESFGGCLALRVAAAAPELVARLVLVNPATCFGQSLFGISSLVAATGLLSIFPKPLYEVMPCPEQHAKSDSWVHTTSAPNPWR